ncbi:hypothetical protein WDU94_002196 [Cyamophila willieti]
MTVSIGKPTPDGDLEQSFQDLDKNVTKFGKEITIFSEPFVMGRKNLNIDINPGETGGAQINKGALQINANGVDGSFLKATQKQIQTDGTRSNVNLSARSGAARSTIMPMIADLIANPSKASELTVNMIDAIQKITAAPSVEDTEGDPPAE